MPVIGINAQPRPTPSTSSSPQIPQTTANITAGNLPFRWAHVAVSVINQGTEERVIVIGGVDHVVDNALNTTLPLATQPTVSFDPKTSSLAVISTAGSFPPSIGHACTHVQTDRSIYCSGGYESTSPAFAPRSRRGLWRFNVDRGEWTATAINGFFDAENDAVRDVGIADAGVAWVNGTMVIVGGRSSCYTCASFGAGFTGSVQGRVTIENADTTIVHDPADGLFGHCTIVSDNNSLYTLFGTATTGTTLTSIARLVTLDSKSQTTITPVQFPPFSPTPPPRLFPSCAKGPDNTIFIYGGITPDSNTHLADLWSLSLSTMTWTSLNSTGIPPPARTRASMIALTDGRVAVQGGLRPDGVVDSALYVLNPVGATAARWDVMVVTANATIPQPQLISKSPSKFLTIGVPIILAILFLVLCCIGCFVWRLWMKVRRRKRTRKSGRVGDEARKSSSSSARRSYMPPQTFYNLTRPPSTATSSSLSSSTRNTTSPIPVPPQRRSSIPAPRPSSLLYSLPNAPLPLLPSLHPPPSTSPPPIPTTLTSPAIPPNLHSIDLTKPYTAKHTHTPARPDETLVSIGDTLTVRKLYRDGWAVGLNVTKKTQGYFPAAVLSLSDWSQSNSNPPSSTKSDSGSSTGSSASTATLVSPPADVLRSLEELDWALEEGVLKVEAYFGQRKRVFWGVGGV